MVVRRSGGEALFLQVSAATWGLFEAAGDNLVISGESLNRRRCGGAATGSISGALVVEELLWWWKLVGKTIGLLGYIFEIK